MLYIKSLRYINKLTNLIKNFNQGHEKGWWIKDQRKNGGKRPASRRSQPRSDIILRF